MFPADHPFRIANFRAYWLSRFTGTIALSAHVDRHRLASL